MKTIGPSLFTIPCGEISSTVSLLDLCTTTFSLLTHCLVGKSQQIWFPKQMESHIMSLKH